MKNSSCDKCSGYGFRIVRVGYEDPILLTEPIYDERECQACDGTGVADVNFDLTAEEWS